MDQRRSNPGSFWIFNLLLPSAVALCSISSPFHKGVHTQMAQWNARHPIARHTWRTASLKKDLDASDFVKISVSNLHGISMNAPLSTADDIPTNEAADASLSRMPQQSYPRRTLPRHIAFVCDGNTRWAATRHLPSSMGHAAGANRTYEIIRYLQQQQQQQQPFASSGNDCITHATFYAFSTENWNRPSAEIREIFNVVEYTARHWYSILLDDEDTTTGKNHIIFKTIGNLYDVRIPKQLRDSLLQLEARTQEIATLASNRYRKNSLHSSCSASTSPPTFLTICVAINYSGRQDILAASRRLILKMIYDKRGAATADDHSQTISEENLDRYINEASFSLCLDTASIPDPDLLIRTSGESRLSNFLLWNLAYTELYFTNTLWPDFDVTAIEKALHWYSQRERRYGKH
jgi:undecaprenyl diphosphate synthase